MVIAVGSCRKNTVISSTSSVASFETVGLGSERDGSMTVRAWGKGKDKADALEQARKNALYDVIFKGVKKGEGTFNARPIIYEVNAETKYEYYFNRRRIYHLRNLRRREPPRTQCCQGKSPRKLVARNSRKALGTQAKINR